MISLSNDTVVFGYKGPVVQVAEVDVREGGVSVTGAVKGIALTPVGSVSVSFSGVPGFRIHIPVPGSYVVAWQGDKSGVQFVPAGAVAAVAVSFDGGASGPEGDPAEITGTASLENADGSVVPISRTVVAMQQAGSQWRVVGSAVSAESDGTYEITGLVEAGSRVYLMAADELGDAFQGNEQVEVDDLIHPTSANGYVYRVVTAGALPATEPQWWTTGQQQIGTATLEAREYLRPLAHGPVPVTFL